MRRWNKWSNIWPTCSVGNYSDFSIYGAQNETYIED